MQYAYLLNTLRLSAASGTEREVYIDVPTALFQLMPTLFPDYDLPQKEVFVEFYLDEDGKHWVLGLTTTDQEESRDLWPYTPSQLPSWVEGALRSRS